MILPYGGVANRIRLSNWRPGFESLPGLFPGGNTAMQLCITYLKSIVYALKREIRALPPPPQKKMQAMFGKIGENVNNTISLISLSMRSGFDTDR
jgi:hypothetical protein